MHIKKACRVLTDDIINLNTLMDSIEDCAMQLAKPEREDNDPPTELCAH